MAIREPKDVLGLQPLTRIADMLRTRPPKEPVYWGLQALAAVCAGDIGDVLQMYDKMLEHGDGPIPPEVQTEVMARFAEQRLIGLAGLDPWLFSHASAFAAASRQELRNSDPGRLRQYTSIFVKIPPEKADLFKKLSKLADSGVLVFLGHTPRYKSSSGNPTLQFKLAFRRILGITHRMPLALRDRFEPAGDDVEAWLDHPTQLRFAPSDDHDDEPLFAAADDDRYELPGRTDPRASAPTVAVQQLLPYHNVLQTLPAPHAVHRAAIAETALLPTSLKWSRATVVAAAGFEDRSLGSWRNLFDAGAPSPSTVILLTYPDQGLLDEISSAITAPMTNVRLRDVDPAGGPKIADEILDEVGDVDENHPLVIDVTSLTKPLIYSLVRQALRRNDKHVWLLHTCAEGYEPYDDELCKAVDLLENRRFPEGFQELDRVTQSEAGPFQPVQVGDQTRDPAQSSLLVAFLSLKLERLTTLLDLVRVERLEAVASVHSSGERSVRSRAMEFAGRYLTARYEGRLHRLGALDAQAAYDLLVELHQAHSLNNAYNFEIALTGTKMQAAGAGMFASLAEPAAVYYCQPQGRDKAHFTHGTAATKLYRLERSKVSDIRE